MYVNEGYTIKDYGSMVHDATRTGRFVEALRRAVTPGCTVLDIGTGTGIFAFLAAQFGASRVYAVEGGPAIEVAKACATNVPGSERIVWIQGLSTAIALPERVDVVIGDLHGSLPFHAGNITSFMDARERHLKPGGKVIPARDLLFAAPAEAPLEVGLVNSPWRSNPYGLDLSAARSHVVNTFWRARPEAIERTQLLAEPAGWGEIDYATASTPNHSATTEFTVERAGTCHGIYAWFDGTPGEGLDYSNAPTLPELVYGRVFFPLEEAVEVATGDRIQVTLKARLLKGNYIHVWDTRITDAGGHVRCDFRQSTFQAAVTTPEQLAKATPDYVPTLSIEGQAMALVLREMAKATPLRQIAEKLAADFPQRFPLRGEALDEVVRLSAKFG
jgi:type I protein arginine methyltransferase